MPIYTPSGPFNSGAAPGVTASFLNAVEAQLVAVPYGINFLASPYHVAANVVINTGTTNTYTVTGGGTGVPTGAKGVLMAAICSGNTVGNFVQFGPHSGINIGLPTVGDFATTGRNYESSFTLPCDNSGQIDVHSGGTGTCTVDLYIYGYVY